MSATLSSSQYMGRKNILTADHLGELVELEDVSSNVPGGQKVNSSMKVLARVVQFDTAGSGTLAAKDPVLFKIYKYGTIVGAKSVLDGPVDGVVDPHLTTTISPGDIFLLFVEGPCPIVVDGAVATTHVKAAGTGKFVDAAFSGAAYAKDVDSRVARLLEDASDSSDGDTVRAYLNCQQHG